MGRRSAPTISARTIPFRHNPEGRADPEEAEPVLLGSCKLTVTPGTLWRRLQAKSKEKRRVDIQRTAATAVSRRVHARCELSRGYCSPDRGVLQCADSLNADCVNTYLVVRDQCNPAARLHGRPVGAQADRSGCAESSEPAAFEKVDEKVCPLLSRRQDSSWTREGHPQRSSRSGCASERR